MMRELKCPNCGKTFTVDEAGYAAIVCKRAFHNPSKFISWRTALIVSIRDNISVSKITLALSKVPFIIEAVSLPSLIRLLFPLMTAWTSSPKQG